MYAVVFMDAIHYHVRSEGQIVKKAVYIAIGVNLEGRKSVLGMWVGENESAKFWASVLNNLKNRKVEDILIACTDNLTGFSEATAAVFPKTDIQNCIIHQLRNSSKYVSYKDIKALMADLKRVYQAVDEQSALAALDDFAEIWDKKYPKISKSWRENWANLSTYFKFPEELRRLIYTTNAIEGFNRQLRKVTKSKAVFPTDDSCSRCCISPCWTSPKSGLAAGRTGRRYTLSSHCTTADAFPNDRRAGTAVSVPGFALRFNSSSY